jgi:hypothetical protein
VIDEVHADAVVTVGEEGDFEFRPNAVSARDENRVFVAPGFELKQAAERADVGEHPRRERRTRQTANPANRFVTGVDVNA